MPKIKETPGAALSALLKKHNLNYNRLAKAIGLSSAMVRLIARDENPVSASVAFRLAKFFKNKPEYWMALQMEYDCAEAAKDKKLAKALGEITTVDKATFERKPRTPKAKTGAKGKAAQGKKPAAKKPGKRGAPKAAKAPAKAGRPAKAAKKPAAAKRGKAPSAPAISPAPSINEPML